MLAAVCLLTGLTLCAQLRKRIRDLDYFVRLFTVMDAQIAYALQPTDALLHHLCRTAEFADFSFVVFLQDAFAKGNPFTTAWKEALKKYTAHAALKATDIDLLCAFGDIFGTTDKNGQTANCAYYISRLKELSGELKSNEKTATRLYLTLGTLGGLFLTILLV